MDIYWKSAASDNFATPTDWSSDSVPGTFDIAKMTVAGTYTITSNALTQVLGITTGANTTLSIQASTFIAFEGTPTGANLGVIDIGNGAVFNCGGTVNRTHRSRRLRDANNVQREYTRRQWRCLTN